MNALIDGTIPGAEAEGYAIFDSLVRYGDEYFVLRDFDDYAAAQERIDRLYRDSLIWQKMALINIASAGIFSSDYTVQQYASQIWDVSSKVHRI
ncbi:glycogen phosphorylase [Sporolactobacillus inulinus]|uniref:Alpha-1,4 glucan phosphorylase n=1 Tax=Sporolactobacillus inulinus TaxID=2078 RepID=A0A4Y1ZAM4_9BACL|nr:glycogen phosphorylase [Sporolactobacillus inulinus]